MAVSPAFLINMSGASVPVYGGNDWSKVVGYLYPREAYSMNGFEGGLTSITFLGPSGSLVSGILREASESVLTPCTSYPHSKEIINGREYYVFQMRSTKSLFDIKGNTIGTVQAGKKVACRSDTAGREYPWLKLVEKYQNASGVWTTVDGTLNANLSDDKKYGFVDTGLRSGSGYSKIAMYGSW